MLNLAGLKADVLRRGWSRLANELIQDAPEEAAFCEFDCRKPQCTHEEWSNCERRLEKARGELMPVHNPPRATAPGPAPKVVYWHEELPPLDGEVIDEHVIEATSDRVHGAIERHGELWHRCYAALMEHTRLRLEKEVTRLGGHYAHVLGEHIDSRRDDASGESWLQGRFSYMLYRRTGPSLRNKEHRPL